MRPGRRMKREKRVFSMLLVEEETKKNGRKDRHLMLINCERCQELLQKISQEEGDQLRRNALSQLLDSVRTQIDLLKLRLKTDAKTKEPSAAKGGCTQDENESQKRALAIQDTVIQRGHLKFDDVAGLNEAKQTLKEAIIMPLQFPHLFTGSRKPWRRILLYGPPGTGKSRLAQAVSSEINSTFYSVSSSDIVSSWVGESEKLIKELFCHAHKQEGRAVVFIDEIDSICRKRSSREEEHTRRVKTELLKQMEGANTHDNSSIFLMCATNCPWELDTAFLRRFQKRIYIPLPDREACLKLIKIHTKESPLHLNEQEWDTLCEQLHGYSGSDIATVVLGALFEPIRDLQSSTHWRLLPDGKIEACGKDFPGAFKSSMTALPPDKVTPREVTLKDILKSLETNRKTVTVDELAKFETFTNSFGVCG